MTGARSGARSRLRQTAHHHLAAGSAGACGWPRLAATSARRRSRDALGRARGGNERLLPRPRRHTARADLLRSGAAMTRRRGGVSGVLALALWRCWALRRRRRRATTSYARSTARRSSSTSSRGHAAAGQRARADRARRPAVTRTPGETRARPTTSAIASASRDAPRRGLQRRHVGPARDRRLWRDRQCSTRPTSRPATPRDRRLVVARSPRPSSTRRAIRGSACRAPATAAGIQLRRPRSIRASTRSCRISAGIRWSARSIATAT